MLGRTRNILGLGAQRLGYWAPTARQQRSLGERGSNMRRVSQQRFHDRHNASKLKQSINLEFHDRRRELSKLERDVGQMAERAVLQSSRRGALFHQQRSLDPAGSSNACDVPVAERKQQNMSSAREMLQLQDVLRKERRRGRNGAFVREEMRVRRNQ